jgi:IS605 OrfB family transposase
MKLTLQTQLLPERDHAAKLKATVERFNEAANWAAGVAFDHRCSNKVELQKIVYRDLRERFDLSSQMAVRCIAQVCEAYRRDKTIRPEFRPHAAMPHDQRTMSFKGPDRVSLLTLGGRVLVPVVMGKYQEERFTDAKGQADLVLREDGKWFLLVTVELPEAAPIPTTDFIGVDLGVKNLATTDDGENFSGDAVEAVRRKYQRIRKTCQRTGTKSAKRKLRKVRKKESGFRKDVNHCIAKKIVAKAQGTNSAIACEDLAGIAERTTVAKPQRNRMKGWAFHQLRCFVTYKALLAGIPVIPVDPRNTSRTCPECGHVAKNNRRSRDHFECRLCEFSAPADQVGAINIRDRAIRDWAFVGKPIVGHVDAGPRNPAECTYKLPGFSPSST